MINHHVNKKIKNSHRNLTFIGQVDFSNRHIHLLKRHKMDLLMIEDTVLFGYSFSELTPVRTAESAKKIGLLV